LQPPRQPDVRRAKTAKGAKERRRKIRGDFSGSQNAAEKLFLLRSLRVLRATKNSATANAKRFFIGARNAK
jgi:hypothetical protein